MALSLPPKIRIAQTPTPIERIEKLPPEFEGIDLYIKRDDFTGSLLQGNKVRKLEYFLPECKKQNVDILITCGGLQSNHCRAVAGLAALYGMKSHLMLRGKQPEIPQANYLLDKLVGAEIEFVTASEYSVIDEIMEQRAEGFRSQGIKPFVIPEGGSNALGLCGYFDCYGEIRKQTEKINIRFDYIVTATGSGGTYGGLLAGAKYYNDKVDILGVNVCYTKDHFVERIFTYLKDFSSSYCDDLDFSKSDINIIDGYVGAGYALSRPEELQLICNLSKTTGILLDPVYTGKAFYGMRDLLIKRYIPKDSKVLFMHTGGLWGLMAIGARFSDHNLI
ncbi:MAG: D-cysteine desulfhydrase family protein [candidate division Zixibacteria bacterium]|nr:D-cysteine desulfhydrase family protein [candidate division Zixibacteria bacterium]